MNTTFHTQRKGPLDPNDPRNREFKSEHYLNYILLPTLSYLLILSFLLPLTLRHFFPNVFSLPSSLSYISVRHRKWTSKRWIIPLAKGTWVWDLRGNRGMIWCWLIVTAYDGFCCWVGTKPSNDPEVFHLPWTRVIANRAGNLCYAHLPIVMLLITRVNAISWLTGVALQDLVFFHKWFGYTTFALGFVHIFIYGVLFTLNPANQFSYFWIHITRPYFQWGLAAAGSFILLILLSIRWIRIKQHELFICSHVIFSVIFFISCYFHWRPRSIFPLSAFLIHLASRLHRYLSLLLNHYIHPFLSPPSRSVESLSALTLPPPVLVRRRALETHYDLGSFEARLEVLDERCLKLVIEVPDALRWDAGQFVYISFPKTGAGRGEWHPFTISNLPAPRLASEVPTNSTPAVGASPSTGSGASSLTHDTFPSSSSPSEISPLLSPASSFRSLCQLGQASSSSSAYPSTSSTTIAPSTASPLSSSPVRSQHKNAPPSIITIILTPQDGLTSKLYHLCLSHTTSTPIRRNSRIVPLLRLPCLVEGPYGIPCQLEDDLETLVMVAGGTGVAYVRAVWEGILRNGGWGESFQVLSQNDVGSERKNITMGINKGKHREQTTQTPGDIGITSYDDTNLPSFIENNPLSQPSISSSPSMLPNHPRKQKKKRTLIIIWVVREEHHLNWIPLASLLTQTLSLSSLNSEFTFQAHFHYTYTRDPQTWLDASSSDVARERHPDANLSQPPLLLPPSSSSSSSNNPTPTKTATSGYRHSKLFTEGTSSTDDNDNDADGDRTGSIHVETVMGRPNLPLLISSAALRTHTGRVKVIVCGPRPLVDSVVDAAVEAMDPKRVRRGDRGGDVSVEAELFD